MTSLVSLTPGVVRGLIGASLQVRSSCLVTSGPDGIAREYVAVWDTGASCSLISARVAHECGLVSRGPVWFDSATGRASAPSYTVDIRLTSGVAFPAVFVGSWSGLPASEADGDPLVDVALGMDLIAQGEFCVTREHGQLVFTFRRVANGDDGT